jgi:hypothetical protein
MFQLLLFKLLTECEIDLYMDVTGCHFRAKGVLGVLAVVIIVRFFGCILERLGITPSAHGFYIW